MSSLKDKVAIVTGGGRDIGQAVCMKLAEAGAAVTVNYHSSAASADETVKRITEAGGRAIAVQADVTSKADIDRMVQETTSAFGSGIHVLVNNAGGLVARKKLGEMDEAFWDHVMALNLKSVFLVSQAVVPHMPEGSAIVNLSSLAARDGGGGGATAYATSKGAVLTFTRGLAKELKPNRVRVNCVSPGMIDTTFHDTFTPPEVREKVAAGTLVGREGTVDDIANAVMFLATDASAYVNAESLEINGGIYFI